MRSEAQISTHMPASCSETQRVIDAEAALRAADAAVRHARQLGVRVNVAVVDAAGVLASFARIGGIGVSGGSESQNEAIATAGLAALGLAP